jgi:glutamate-5-semialdehyde dehydrogenase
VTVVPSLPELARNARRASRELAAAGRIVKDQALRNLAARLLDEAGKPGGALFQANLEDLTAAEAGGVSGPMLDRLKLDPARVRAMAEAVLEISRAADPVGEVTHATMRPNGLLVGQVRAPLGVIAMIYEARPNVTVEAFALTLKSGNAVIMRGGKEAVRSNAALAAVAHAALADAGLPTAALSVVTNTDRDSIRELVSLTGLIDLVIPRGGEGLIRFVTEHARVPVIQHYKGVCHTFVDRGADLELALKVVENAKLSRVSVCNALECLLVDELEAPAFLPMLAGLKARGLELRGDEQVQRLIEVVPATEADWGCEFLDKVLAVRVVPNFDAALAHIAQYGSNHTECIITRDYERAQRWKREVDASCVVVNASTRFNDGGELGLGAEMGISTSKLHAYGPMGLVHLTTLKWFIEGNGQIRTP